MLNHSEFYNVVKSTPLIAVDFLIFDNESKNILLGKRLNNPAKDSFFSFGNAVFKNETLSQSMNRVLVNELNLQNVENYLKNAEFNGIFEQFYENNFLDNSATTHYVVISYALKINKLDLQNNKGNDAYTNQHENIKWFELSKINNLPDVHEYVKTMINHLLK